MTLRPKTLGWLLDDRQRLELLSHFPPTYPDVIAHHVTYAYNISANAPLPAAIGGVVVGIADDRQGVQALVIEIAGTTIRPDGSTYHITWSLHRRRGRKPVESNDVIAKQGWTKVEPIALKLRPARF